MALNDLDRPTILEAIRTAYAATQVIVEDVAKIAEEVTKIKEQLYAILRDVQD